MGLTETSDEEASIDTFDGGEVDTFATEERVDEIVENRNHDDDTNGIQVPAEERVGFVIRGLHECNQTRTE